jgi:hypothetical protein
MVFFPIKTHFRNKKKNKILNRIKIIKMVKQNKNGVIKNKMEKKREMRFKIILFFQKKTTIVSRFTFHIIKTFYKSVKKLLGVNLIWIQNLGVFQFSNIKV